MGRKIAAPGAAVFAGQLREPVEICLEPLEFGIDHRVGTIGGNDPPSPAAIVNGAMVLQRVERVLGRGEELDVEPLEQRTRAELLPLELCGDRVETEIGGFAVKPHVQPEHLGEHPVEPDSRRRSPKQVVPLGEDAPRFPRIGRGADAKRLQRHALRMEHAEQVMVGLEQQLGRVAEGLVEREPGGIGVPMGADDRQRRHGAIELARDLPHAGFGGKQAVGVEFELAWQPLPPWLVFCRTLTQW